MYLTNFFDSGAGFPGFQRLQTQLNSLFQGVEHGAESFPAMNVWTNDENIAVAVEVPGIEPKALDISVVGDTLFIKGERKPDDISELKEASVLRQEREYGAFTRALQLPYRVETEKVSAKYQNGILHLTLPKAESDKPRKIAVQ